MATDDEDKLFRDAMKGVEKLPDDKRVPRGVPNVAASPKSTKKAPVFTVERDNDSIEGRAHGVTHQQLAPFARGDIGPEERVDLHGTNSERARELIRKRTEAAASRGLRCIIIIHGKGTHSEDGISVLRETTIETLCKPPCSKFVLGFCSAPKQYGGSGAMMVALRVP